jgi:excisionase family DNA binding protein
MSEQCEGLGYRSPEWVAEQLGLDKTTVYHYLRQGVLPGLQLGRKWLINEQGMRDFLAKEQEAQTVKRRKP